MSGFVFLGFCMKKSARRWALLCVSLLFLVGSSAMAGYDGPSISTDELLAGTAFELDPNLPDIITNADALALSDPMREFLRTYVDDRARSFVKLNQLTYAVISEGSFGLEYGEATRTAAETFISKQANCMSFTNMFVVLARGVGMDARFQEVDIPPEWTFDNKSYVLNRHINISIDLGTTGIHVVDFNIADFKGTYDMRTISDERAMSHFFNNMGIELMQHGEVAKAFFALRRAIAENDRKFSPAWTSLGTLYSRAGLSYHAEAAYLQAIDIDRSDLVAMSNLSVLYQRRGDQEQAAYYRKRLHSHRKQNPYYRCQLAREAIVAKDYDEAIGHLKFAARKRKDEHVFYALLGFAYLQKGNEEASRKWMAKAEEFAPTNELKSLYSTKIDRLKAASG